VFAALQPGHSSRGEIETMRHVCVSLVEADNWASAGAMAELCVRPICLSKRLFDTL
jgi:hypothetical protein